MKIFKALTKWQLWASLLLMGLICFGAYHFLFKVWLYNYTNHNQEIEIPELKSMELGMALKKLDSLKLNYEIDSIRYDSTYPPHVVIEVFPEKGFKVKEGRKIFVKANPKGWLPTTLPDIVGKSKRLAFTQLKLNGLSVSDTIYEADIAKDAVLRVLYKGKPITKGSELPRFSKVDLVLGKGLEYGVKTPNLVGLTLGAARSSVLSSQFENGRLNVDGAVGDSSLLIVFYQYPLPNDNYDQGLPIDLWVSEKDPKELQEKIKELNRQYRNFGDNDSIAAEKYAEELKQREKDSNLDSKTKKDQKLPKKEEEPPSGFEMD